MLLHNFSDALSFPLSLFSIFPFYLSVILSFPAIWQDSQLRPQHSGETGIGGVGNKEVTSKCDYMYQRLDGEASISCCWQKVSLQSQFIWSPWLRPGPITGRLFQIVLTKHWLKVQHPTETGAVLLQLCVEKLSWDIRLFVWRISFISFVEPPFLVYV